MNSKKTLKVAGSFFVLGAMLISIQGVADPSGSHALPNAILNFDTSNKGRFFDFSKPKVVNFDPMIQDYEAALTDSLKRLYRLRGSIDGLPDMDTHPDPKLNALAQAEDKIGRKDGSNPLPNPRLQFALLTEVAREENLFKRLEEIKKNFEQNKKITPEELKELAQERANLDFVGILVRTGEAENVGYRAMLKNPAITTLFEEIGKERAKPNPNQAKINVLFTKISDLRVEMEKQVSKEVLAHYTKEVKANFAVNKNRVVRENAPAYANLFKKLAAVLGPEGENALPTDPAKQEKAVKTALRYTQANLPLSILKANKDILQALTILALPKTNADRVVPGKTKAQLQAEAKKWQLFNGSLLQLVGDQNGQPNDPQVHDILFNNN